MGICGTKNKEVEKIKRYRGKKSAGAVRGQIILVEEDEKLYPLKHIVRHSSDFNWGYGGSGPADTALSILTDCLGREQANTLYQFFKWAFVAGWGNEFSITEKEIKDWTEEQLKQPK